MHDDLAALQQDQVVEEGCRGDWILAELLVTQGANPMHTHNPHSNKGKHPDPNNSTAPSRLFTRLDQGQKRIFLLSFLCFLLFLQSYP